MLCIDDCQCVLSLSSAPRHAELAAEIRNIIKHKNLCNAVFTNIVGNTSAKKAQINKMVFLVVVDNNLSEAIHCHLH